jgi:transcriptional regulator with XRE-family HTH domain
MPADLEKLGRLLADARRGRGLTQAALAAKARAAGLDVSDKYVGLIENATIHERTGRPRQPGFEVIKFFAAELGQPEREWLDLAGYAVADRPASSAELAESGVLFSEDFYRDLTPAQLERLGRIIGRERERRAKPPKRKPKPPPH